MLFHFGSCQQTRPSNEIRHEIWVIRDVWEEEFLDEQRDLKVGKRRKKPQEKFLRKWPDFKSRGIVDLIFAIGILLNVKHYISYAQDDDCWWVWIWVKLEILRGL